MPRLWVLGVLALVSCGGGDPSDPQEEVRVEVDPLLTRRTFIGGDVVLVGSVTGCPTSLDAVNVHAKGLEVASFRQVATTVVDLVGVDDEPRPVFDLGIGPASWSPAAFGLPVNVGVQLEVYCGAKQGSSPPFDIAYLPTVMSVVPTFVPRRFWPDTREGDVLACEGGTLRQYLGALIPGGELSLGFPCGTAEMRGLPWGRRILYAKDAGIAAILPGPRLGWSRSLSVIEAHVPPGGDPVVVYAEGQQRFLAVLNRTTGETIEGPFALPGVPLGQPGRDAQGNLLVLLAERPAGEERLVYRVSRITPAPHSVTTFQVGTYEWMAPSYLAAFSEDFTAIYLTSAPAADSEPRLQKVSLLDCPDEICVPQWTASAPWSLPLAELYGRLLAAGPDALVWLDPVTGEPASEAFAPDSGNLFLRAHVEEDGSVVMIADPVGDVGQGLYVFDPLGVPVLRLHPEDAAFRWLTPGWNDEALVSYFEELHRLYNRGEYVELVAP